MKVGLMLALGHDDGLGRPLDWPRLRDMALAAEAGCHRPPAGPLAVR